MDLSDILKTHPDLLSDGKKIKSVLADYYSGDVPRINRMMKAYELGIIDSLASNNSIELEKKKIVNQLIDLHDMQEKKAIEAVDEWSQLCSSDVLKSYIDFQTQENKKKEELIAGKAENSQNSNIKNDIQEEIERQADELNVNYEDYDRYYNLDLSDGKPMYGIPCGVGSSDYGFIVRGTGHEDLNVQERFPSVQAIVYNFLIRNSHITKDSYPQYMKNHFFNRDLDYGHIFRYMMILIDLLNPSGETVLKLNLLGDKDELQVAIEILNEYLALFSRLTKSKECSIRVEIDSHGKSISVEGKADYYVENYKKDQGLRRRLRYGQRVNYSLSIEDKEDLEFLLKEISPFTTFKRGQFNALCSMLNSNDHAVCIMPTGSGKSLIYYFACILQPQVVFVVSPTDILIKDQIRNLKKFHHFDNVTHLDLRSENDFSFFKPGTNLIFLTPATFQNRNLFGIFKRRKNEISYVVLDEIHCLSNWGHDFRPEYLMLSRNMLKYLENARYLGFTATANYTVAQDIQKQLGIPYENFFSPVLFEKYNVRYDFREVDSMEDMFEQVKAVADDIVRRNERALVFTKTADMAIKVADAIGFEADVFAADKPESYSQFVDGLCKILVASEDLGIGINLPNVNCTVHFGIPISKNEFVQEIGRAGRADERVTSYVLYLKPSEDNIPEKLLKRETFIDNLPHVLATMNNDYSDVYHVLNCGADTSDILFDRLIDIYSDFHSGQKTLYLVKQNSKGIEQYKQLLYMLFATGYIKDWYTNKATQNNIIEIIVDICSLPNVTGHKTVAISDFEMLDRMKKVSREYYSSMDNDRESVFNVTRASKIEEVIKIYVKWYYEKFLYHHKEQFLDFFDFLVNNKDCDSVKITEEIEDYFTLPFIQIKEDEAYYTGMTIEELSNQVTTGIGKNTLSNLERINSDSYSYKLDYILFTGRWAREGRFEVTRLERFWNKLSGEEKKLFLNTMSNLYRNNSLDARLTYLDYVDDPKSVMGLELKEIVDDIYQDNPKDIIYYGVLAMSANRKFAVE